MKTALRQAQEYAPLDISSYLDNEEVIAEFLTAAAEDENPDILLSALANVAKARGMANVAQAAGLGRESLYKTLAPGARPRFHTVQAILRALNVRLSLQAPSAALKSTKLAAKAARGATKAAAKRALKSTKLAAKAARGATKAAAKRPAPAKKRA